VKVLLVRVVIHIGTLYAAHDNIRNETVALKVEKADKAKKVLLFEYKVLKDLQGIVRVIL
jgi:predicted Ser/Thr protein kinase